MADRPPYPDTGDDTGVAPNRGSTTGTPRWVKVFWIIALILVLLVVVGLLTGRAGPGGHGPSRHTSSGDARPSSVAELTQLVGGYG
jgi:hypothetical protein